MYGDFGRVAHTSETQEAVRSLLDDVLLYWSTSHYHLCMVYLQLLDLCTCTCTFDFINETQNEMETRNKLTRESKERPQTIFFFCFEQKNV